MNGSFIHSFHSFIAWTLLMLHDVHSTFWSDIPGSIPPAPSGMGFIILSVPREICCRDLVTNISVVKCEDIYNHHRVNSPRPSLQTKYLWVLILGNHPLKYRAPWRRPIQSSTRGNGYYEFLIVTLFKRQ